MVSEVKLICKCDKVHAKPDEELTVAFLGGAGRFFVFPPTTPSTLYCNSKEIMFSHHDRVIFQLSSLSSKTVSQHVSCMPVKGF